MANKSKKERPSPSPPKSAEAYEQRLIALAYSEAERQIREGTAAATTINHFLKLGSVRDQLEKAKLEAETKLAEQKIAEIASSQDANRLAEEALRAFKTYSGVQ